MYKTKTFEVKYFDTIPDLKNYVSIHEFRKGQVLFYKEHLPYGLFLLISGEVEITGGSRTSVIVNKPAFLGYDAFIEKKPYSVTAKARTDCRIYFLSQTDYQALAGKNKTLVSWINR